MRYHSRNHNKFASANTTFGNAWDQTTSILLLAPSVMDMRLQAMIS